MVLPCRILKLTRVILRSESSIASRKNIQTIHVQWKSQIIQDKLWLTLQSYLVCQNVILTLCQIEQPQLSIVGTPIYFVFNFAICRYNFIPKSLIIQFRRASNVYFLITTILILIPGFSVLPAYSSIGPLAFVLIMSMLREGYEDFKRRRNDSKTNNQKCRVMRKKFQTDPPIDTGQTQIALFSDEQCPFQDKFIEIKWADVKCGDIILIKEGEYFPADAVLLISSAENDECFVQTSSLDGERALKHKQCLAPIKHAITTHGLGYFKSFINSEQPHKNLYSFKGYMESHQFPEKSTILLSSDSNLRTVSLDNKQLALRGSNLANTNWVIAAVLYTGKQSKQMMNQGLARFKQSKLEKLVNSIVIYLIFVQALLCILMAIFCGVFTQHETDGQGSNSFYIYYVGIINHGLEDGQSPYYMSYNSRQEGAKAYAQYYILLNTVIPISLIVSIEFVKILQTPFIQHDVNMYDPETMKQCTPFSLTLHEELGFVNYVFADKTGTLTSNVMQFMGCTVGRVCYDEDYNEEDYDYEIDTSTLFNRSPRADIVSLDQPEEEQKYDISLQEDDAQSKVEEFEQIKKEKGYPFNKKGGQSKINRRNSATKIVWNFTQATAIIRGLLEQRKCFQNEEMNLGKSDPHSKALILRNQNEYLKYFWLNVILCHDVIATKHKSTGQLAYQGPSPDEITLLDAAKEVGFIFTQRNSENLTAEIFGKQKTFLIKQKIEFTSDRKKMSVVIEDPETGFLLLFTKGADFAIFERLSKNMDQPFLQFTKDDLVKFSTKGYRTLCFAIRVLEKEYYENWTQRYEQAKLDQIKLGLNKNYSAKKEEESQQNNPEANLLELLQAELESQLFLLGATALEDKLQEGVPEVIDDFHHAGIKVWMLTGDKLETAENIGFSSKMFNEKMFIFKLQTQTHADTKNRLHDIDHKINEIHGQHQQPLVGTQFILNPNAGLDIVDRNNRQSLRKTFESCEARNILKALEEYKHETVGSVYTLNESWARKPVFRRKIRKRIEEIAPDKTQIIESLVAENQFFKNHAPTYKYIPSTFDMTAKQYIVRNNNIYRTDNRSTVNNEDTFGVIIEGQTLLHITDSDSLKKKFLKILGKCQAVIVCRASPSQKAVVVQMVKDNEPQAVTLAIGDGANDVNMIQKAHVGIGLFGKEGYQAAGSSDYAIGQFQFLKRLMFVHGRWNGMRLSNFVLFFFHKNLVFTLPQFWFGLQSGFSGQTYWNDAYLTMFNTIITAFALGDYAIWEQDINLNDPVKNQLINFFFPFIYRDSQSDMLTKTKFFIWFAVSTVQSLFIYGIPMLVMNGGGILKNGYTPDLWFVSTCSFFAQGKYIVLSISLVHLHYLMLCIFTKNWTIWTVSWYLLNYLLFNPIFIFVYDRVVVNSPIHHTIGEIVYQNGNFWLVQIITVASVLLPIYFYFAIQNLLFPTLKDLIIQDKINYKHVIEEADPRRLKATQELFRQQQQQQEMLMQIEYQNFQLPHVVEGLPVNQNEEQKKQVEELQKTLQQYNMRQKGQSALSLGKLIRNLSETEGFIVRNTLINAGFIEKDNNQRNSEVFSNFGKLRKDSENLTARGNAVEMKELTIDLDSENYACDDSFDKNQLQSGRKMLNQYVMCRKEQVPQKYIADESIVDGSDSIFSEKDKRKSSETMTHDKHA